MPCEQPNQNKILSAETTTLKELVNLDRNIIYVPRRVDIERLRRLAVLGSDKPGAVSVLDVGGGHGFLDKLLADEFKRAGIECSVIAMDNDSEKIEKAKQNYGNTDGLQFVAADAEKEGVDLYKEPFDLMVVSWPRNQIFGSCYAYTNIIQKNRPQFVVWVGDERIGDLTAEFDTADNYQPIAEWYSRHNSEVNIDLTQHGESPSPRRGSNLFTVYARTDMPTEKIAVAREALKQQNEGPKYNWEKELERKFPRNEDGLKFEVERRVLDDEE